MRIGTSAVVLLFASILPALSRAEEWPRFRGPTGQGISEVHDPPLHWGDKEGIAWKTAIPGTGWSSPVIWGDRIFLTSTTEDGVSCHVICVNRDTGSILWDTEAFKQLPTKKQERNSYATPTPVTDGSRVYAFFSSGKAVALDFEGKFLWKNESLHFYAQQGMGVSPILYGDVLIMPWDHSSETPPKEPGWIKAWDQSYVLALDKQTGAERYKAMRGMTRASHATPQVIEVDGQKQLISPAGDFVQGFDPDTGKKLWEVGSKGETPVPSVVYGDGLLFTTSGFEDPTIRAVRPGKPGETGTLDHSHVVWETRKSVPMMPSFVFANHLLFAVKEKPGIATCYDAPTGKVLWQERIGGGNANYSSSPLWADGRIYFLSDEGVTTVVAASGEFKILAVNTLAPEAFHASIAVSDGKFFVRSDKGLYCIR